MKDVYTDIGSAKLDFSRKLRTGMAETVFCSGKTPEQLRDIVAAFKLKGCRVLGTRCEPGQYRFLKEAGLEVAYDPCSRVLTLSQEPAARSLGGVAVCAAGTSDLPVAEEAARTAEFFGAEVRRYYDVGVAGLHRLLAHIEEIRQAQVVIAVAGMEGALGSVLTGLVAAPVIAVPTSVGYGASFGGLAPLLSMLNSCAEGLSVVNIDNGFGAAAQACRILSIPFHHE